MFIQLAKEFQGKAIGEKIDIDEPIAKAMIANGTAVTCSDPLEKAMEGYAAKFQAALDSQVNATVKAYEQAASKSRKNAVPAIFGEGNRGDVRQNSVDLLKCVVSSRRRASVTCLCSIGLEATYFGPIDRRHQPKSGLPADAE